MLTLYVRIQKIIIVFTILILTIGSINCGKNQQGIQHISNVLDNLHKYINKQVTFNGVVTSVTNAADQQTVGFYYIIDISNKSIKVMTNKLPVLNEKVSVTGIVKIDIKLKIPYLRETSKLIVGGEVNNSDSSNTANYKNDKLPKYKGYINDYANILSSDDSEMIHMMLSMLDEEMGIQAVVITINSVKDYGTSQKTIKEFATGLLNKWRIGEEKNNGVVILLSLKEQKCRIVLGAGYEEAYNSVMGQIIDEKMIPYFAKSEYSKGIYEGVSEIILEITKADFGNEKKQSNIQTGKIIAEEILSEDNLVIEAKNEGVKMTIPSYCLDGKSKSTIRKIVVTPPEENIEMNAYELKIHTNKRLNGIIKIEIPYDQGRIPDGMTAKESIGAAYYNEEKGFWEPTYHELDTNRNIVIIKTDHLSSWAEYTMKKGIVSGYGRNNRDIVKGFGRIQLGSALKIEKKPDFGIFYTKHKYTVYEKAYRYSLITEKIRSGLISSNRVLKDIALYGMDASSKIKTDFAVKMIGDTSSTISGGSTLLNVSVYKRVWSEALENSLGKVGGGLVLFQVASDLYHGKNAEETLWNLFKGVLYWQGSAAAGYMIGASAIPFVQVGLVGLFSYELVFGPIDSPIPKWKNYYVHKKAFQAYYEYYHSSPKRGGNYRSNSYWNNKIKELNNEVISAKILPRGFKDKGVYLKALIKKELKDYSKEFWMLGEKQLTEKVATTEGSGVFGSYDRAYYVPDKDNHNKTCAGEYVREILNNKYSGLKEEMEDKFINDLVKNRLQPMINEIREEIMIKREKELAEYFDKLQDVLNRKIKIQIYDRGKKKDKQSVYKGYSIWPKSNSINMNFKNQWHAVIDESGNASLEFTLLAHQRAGSFTELEIYKPKKSPEKHKPSSTIKFEIGERIIRIPLEKLVPEEKKVQMNFDSNLFGTWLVIEKATGKVDTSGAGWTFKNDGSCFQGSLSEFTAFRKWRTDDIGNLYITFKEGTIRYRYTFDGKKLIFEKYRGLLYYLKK